VELQACRLVAPGGITSV